MITETLIDRMAHGIRYVRAVPVGAATGPLAEIYRQMQADFLPVPLLTLHSPAPEILAGVWSSLRESLLAGHVERTLKEAVAATVSKSNECPFCVDAHAALLHATDDHDVADAILRGDYGSIHDPKLQAHIQWMLANRTRNPGNVLPAPFSSADAPEIIGSAITFHYINRMVNVFLGDTLLPVPAALKGVTGRLLGATGKKMVRRARPGDSLKFVPQADLPDEFAWARANPVVAAAFAGFSRIVDEAAVQVLPEPVRQLVSERVQAWQGETMPMSRRWVEQTISPLDPAQQAAARLTLLTALASYQVDFGVVETFRAHIPGDAELIAATAWASLTATRRVSAWLAESFITEGR